MDDVISGRPRTHEFLVNGTPVSFPDDVFTGRDALTRSGHTPASEFQIVLVRVHHIERMDAKGRTDVAMRRCQRAHRSEAAAVHRRHDETLHAGCARRAHDLVAVRSELGGVQMDVGIDQHRQPPADQAGLSAP